MKLTKNISRSEKRQQKELSTKEFQKLDIAKRLNKVIRLYFQKCTSGVLYKNNKMNFAAWNSVKTVILDNFNVNDLVVVYEYLKTIEFESMSIYKVLYLAEQFRKKQINKVGKEQLKQLKVSTYKEFSLDDFI